MNHFVFSMVGSDMAPAGGGTTEGWFFHYKWDVDDEAYIPVPDTHAAPEAGDTLWFLLNTRVIGCAPVLRVQDDELNSRLEIYYDTRYLQDSKDQATFHSQQPTGLVTGPSSIAFFSELKKRYDIEFRPRNQMG